MAGITIPHLLDSVVELTSQQDQPSLQVCLTKGLRELMSADEIMLYSISAETGKLTLRLLAGIESPEQAHTDKHHHPSIPLVIDEYPDLMQCFTSQKMVISQWQKTTGQEKRTGIKVVHPVIGEHGIIGLLIIKCASITQKDQNLVSSFLRIYHNYLVLIDANERDPLTELLNRKVLSERLMTILTSQTEKLQRKSDNPDKHGQHCLAMLDIDHFKQVNDKFGHLYGDEVLLLFAQLMKKTFRAHDQLYRYGGEEFIAILKSLDMDTSLRVLERFRKTVASFRLPQSDNITVSVGAVEINYQDLPSTTIEQADKALYYAKDHGRNQICEYGRLLREGKINGLQSQGSVEIFNSTQISPKIFNAPDRHPTPT